MKTDCISSIQKVVTRSLGIAAAAGMMFSLTPVAQALSLSNPAMAPAAKHARDALTTEVQHRGHGGGGFRGGGGFHGGGFRGGGPAFHGGGFRGGGFRAAAPAFRSGSFQHRPAFHGSGIRYGGPAFVRRGVYAPAYYGHHRYVHRHRHFAPRYYGYVGPRYYSFGPRYYAPRRFCRVIWTYYGPRKICRYRPWHHRHWHHRRHFNVYW